MNKLLDEIEALEGRYYDCVFLPCGICWPFHVWAGHQRVDERSRSNCVKNEVYYPRNAAQQDDDREQFGTQIITQINAPDRALHGVHVCIRTRICLSIIVFFRVRRSAAHQQHCAVYVKKILSDPHPDSSGCRASREGVKSQTRLRPRGATCVAKMTTTTTSSGACSSSK